MTDYRGKHFSITIHDLVADEDGDTVIPYSLKGMFAQDWVNVAKLEARADITVTIEPRKWFKGDVVLLPSTGDVLKRGDSWWHSIGRSVALYDGDIVVGDDAVLLARDGKVVSAS